MMKGRRVWFELAQDANGRALPKYCPAGHRFHDPLVWTSAGLACHHKGTDSREDCSYVVLLIGGDLKDVKGQPRNLLTMCTREEMREMESKRMNLDQMLEFLGLDRGLTA
ncbi:MAG: hypothetical protein ACJ8AK_03110 [Gemmatimonadaceae bacterium]